MQRFWPFAFAVFAVTGIALLATYSRSELSLPNQPLRILFIISACFNIVIFGLWGWILFLLRYPKPIFLHLEDTSQLDRFCNSSPPLATRELGLFFFAYLWSGQFTIVGFTQGLASATPFTPLAYYVFVTVIIEVMIWAIPLAIYILYFIFECLYPCCPCFKDETKTVYPV